MVRPLVLSQKYAFTPSNKESGPPNPPVPSSTGEVETELTGNKVAENEAAGVNKAIGTRVLKTGVAGTKITLEGVKPLVKT